MNSEELTEALKVKADKEFIENNSAEYVEAHKVHGVAAEVFRGKVKAFRSSEISDVEFVKAKKVYEEAGKAFDIAYDKEKS